MPRRHNSVPATEFFWEKQGCHTTKTVAAICRRVCASLNSSFCSMKRLRILLLPLDGMLDNHKVTPQHYDRRRYPFIHLGEERQCLRKQHDSRKKTNNQPLDRKANALTTKPSRIVLCSLAKKSLVVTFGIKQALTEDRKTSPSGRRARSSEPFTKRHKQDIGCSYESSFLSCRKVGPCFYSQKRLKWSAVLNVGFSN